MMISEEAIWQALGDVVDPEIPVVSLIEMGVIRGIEFEGEALTVTITPTFSACPALHVMQEDIRNRLLQEGVSQVQVNVIYNPPWSSDWISPSARQKIKEIGLAPPALHAGNFTAILVEPVACPYCDSEETTLKNSFGPTPCRMIYYCNACTQPFEQFKPI